MPLTAPRGTVDLLPAAAARAQHLETLARQRFAQAGYGEIRTPHFEDTALFSRSIGSDTDIVSKEMYTFADRKGRSLTLRPENTAGVVRAFVEHKLYTDPAPTKLFYVGPMFRYERPQAGRTRQFDQIGAEVLGSAAPGYDVEIAALAYDIFRDLGFTKLTVGLNSLGCAADRPAYYDALRSHFAHHLDELCPECRARLDTNPMRVLDCKVPGCQPLLAAAPTPFDFICADCRTHHDTVIELLAAADLPYTEDRTLVRGLDYYTRTVFEVHHAGLGARSALCGGGRYDGLVEQLGGPPTPAVGFSIGVVPVLLAAEREGLVLPGDAGLDAVICLLTPDARSAAQRMVTALRNAGLVADVDWSGRRLKAQLKSADRRRARFAVLLGEDELAAGAAQVRELDTSTQTPVPLDGVAAHLAAKRSGS